MKQKIKKETIIRTIVLVVAIMNSILAIAGKDTLPLYESDIAQFVSLAAFIVSSLWAWWKNNSFTQAAIESDDVLETIRAREENSGAE
ncbi:MAG: phage holin [Clostridia bacterium]|nr:phage holin [Clostridia bacterium]